MKNSTASRLDLKDNHLLREEILERSKAQIMEWPSVTINNFTYKGKVEAENIMQAICVSLENAPSGCNKYDPNYIA